MRLICGILCTVKRNVEMEKQKEKEEKGQGKEERDINK